MASYIHFTDEQKQRANYIDLVDFLRRQGEQLTRSGREWRWKRHDSVTIRGNQWFRHSSRQGGLAIDFVQEFYGLTFPDAVTLLLGGEQGAAFKQSNKKTPEPERKEFLLPEAAPNMRRVYAYLLKQRYIDRDVLTHFVRKKKIFEDKEYHNVVFVGFDENVIARHAHKRGTYSNAAGYRGNVEGSDPKYSFNHIGTSDTLYVFEAPIDMLSYISLYQRGWQQQSYVTLDGVAEHAMLEVLSQNNYLSNVVMCLDHDAAGIEAAGRLAEILREKGYNKISCLQSAFKDWNEDLKAQHGITPIPAQEHPKIEACRDLCKELRNLCSGVKAIKSPYERLMEHYGKFSSLTQNGKVMVGRDAIAMEQLQSMASYALLAVQEQYRQGEKPVLIEQLTKELYESYHPHQDKGKLRVKADELQQDITAMNDQLHIVGIRTLDDKQKIISSYMSLALNCVKTHIFIDREGQEQKIIMQHKPNLNQTDGEQVICEETSQPQYNLS
ncbi:toprim domain-containing protein [Desulfosporosinus metallidurans]|uniref:DUF3991 domain-containing protein n=1 Tax=Desulfosporosinus metallidurans TaxID=1888891 RepID=A0A1Q8QVJ8_9FIRM|nr:toprim domain-containing protein [Desulfosporosinus metallidurans]OLN31350.1 hypothetical protein DSOL_2689 [Desulfosporosinus metallidurans]